MNLEFEVNAVEDLLYWLKTDKKKAIKIFELAKEITKNPFSGPGKPEPLKYNLSGLWSRRIDLEHRLVYSVLNDRIIIISCRFHY